MTDNDRLANSLASRLTDEIRAANWVEGTILGSEAELMERYGVGRNVLREAARMLEQQGVARIRMGRGGGLVVASPDERSTARAVELYLASRGVSARQIIEAKREVELTCVRLAVRQVNKRWARRLREAVTSERQKAPEDVREIGADNVHIMIAEMAGNPALQLFIDALTHLSASYVPQRHAEVGADGTYDAHARIAEAIARGDEAAAVKEMSDHLDHLNEELLARIDLAESD